MEARASCRGGSAAASFFLRKRLRPGEPPGERVLKGRPPGECVLKGKPPGERHGRQQMPRLLQGLGKAERELRLLPCLKYLWGIRNAWVDSEIPGHLFIDLSTHQPLHRPPSIHSSSHPSTQVRIHTPPPLTCPSVHHPLPHTYTHSHQHLLTHPHLQVSTHQGIRLFVCLCSLFCHPHIPVSTRLCPVSMCDPVLTIR